jgi:putative DNA primase/helicase
VLLHCFAGCNYQDVRQAVEDLSDGRFVPQASCEDRQPSTYRLDLCTKILAESQPITEGDTAHRYFSDTRRLPIDHTDLKYLRLHYGLDYFVDGESIGKYPCVISRMTYCNDTLAGIHRTYLGLPEGYDRRKVLSVSPGSTKGAAIRIHKPGKSIVVSEGIETGLACHLLFDLPVLAAGNAYTMSQIVLPGVVESVTIAVDNDRSRTGQRYAEVLTDRLRKEGCRVKLATPPVLRGKSVDWADVFTAPELFV